MNFLIIFPDWGYFPLSYRRTIPPLNPAVLAGILKQRGEVLYVDERLEKIPFDNKFDVVFITAMTNQIARAYQIAAKFKLLNVIVTIGGVHPSLLPAEASKFVDAVFIGEAEDTLPQFLNDLENKTIKPVYRCRNDVLTQLKNVLPDRSIYPGKGYLPLDPIQLFRGCRLACEACSVPQTQGKLVFFKEFDFILQDISTSQDYLFFINDDLYFHRKKIEPILNEMISMKKLWLGLGSAEMARDTSFLKMISNSGCWLLYLDFGPREALALNNPKRLSAVIKQIIDRIKRFKNFGIKLIASFTFGFEFDTINVFENSVNFCNENGIDEAEFHILVPYPKTRFAMKLEKEKRIFSHDWKDYNATKVVFTPKNISQKQLEIGYNYAWNTFFKLPKDAANPIITIDSLLAFPDFKPEKLIY